VRRRRECAVESGSSSRIVTVAVAGDPSDAPVAPVSVTVNSSSISRSPSSWIVIVMSFGPSSSSVHWTVPPVTGVKSAGAVDVAVPS
jgi:hypothetical protein